MRRLHDDDGTTTRQRDDAARQRDDAMRRLHDDDGTTMRRDDAMQRAHNDDGIRSDAKTRRDNVTRRNATQIDDARCVNNVPRPRTERDKDR